MTNEVIVRIQAEAESSDSEERLGRGCGNGAHAAGLEDEDGGGGPGRPASATSMASTRPCGHGKRIEAVYAGAWKWRADPVAALEEATAIGPLGAPLTLRNHTVVETALEICRDRIGTDRDSGRRGGWAITRRRRCDLAGRRL